MRAAVIVLCLAPLLLALQPLSGTALAHPPTDAPGWREGSRPDFIRDYIEIERRRLAVNPQPWELVWPRAWKALAEGRERPATTAEIHDAIATAATSARADVMGDVYRWEEEERRERADCAERVLANASAAADCEVPCRDGCPAALTKAEQIAMARQARIAAGREKAGQLDALEAASRSRLDWKRSQGEVVD
ncbi:MAG: hypothetical protein ACK4RV_15110 [Caulobacter sp.]